MLITEYTNKELELMNLIESGASLWLPNPDNAPQVMAYLSDAHTVGFGGAAGGGKTELIIGKALNQHEKTMIVREEGTQMTSIIDRLTEIMQGRAGYNGQERIWRMPKRGQQVEFGSIPNPGDETKYQGRPHDFLAFDEATNVRVSQIRFLSTWLRTATPGQRTEVLLTFNPPSTAEGRWVLDYFSPWLETKAAESGEIRYFITIETRDIEVPNEPCVIIDKEPVFDFDPAGYKANQIIRPQSRTFIPSRVTDNTYLGQEYLMQLQALPEPLRSQMLEGDFTAGIEDDAWQVIPTEWVRKAMDAWEKPDVIPPMASMGVDVARGGRDNTIIFRRHEDMWFDAPLAYPGHTTPDGPAVAGLIVTHMRDQAPVHIDVVGVGSSPYDFLKIARFQIAGVNGGERSNAMDKPGRMGFSNRKSELWWKMREALDPHSNVGVRLPPDPQLLKDLTSLTWRPEGGKIKVETRKEIIKRIGRSPDWGSACVLAMMDTPKRSTFGKKKPGTGEYDPFDIFEE